MELKITSDALEKEKEKTDELLHSMMPVEVATMLKKGEKVQQTFPECTSKNFFSHSCSELFKISNSYSFVMYTQTIIILPIQHFSHAHREKNICVAFTNSEVRNGCI